MLTNYGVGTDLFIARNICLRRGVTNWQNPASLRNDVQTNALGVIDTFSVNICNSSRFLTILIT